ncbi:MAG: FAD-dependent oxidoreductase [Myxococcales bacterium]|nr:MAG: FAD-dependent oxidoreductase [Myxococcales bacterium]
MTQLQPVGAVLVVGAGIGGMQAAIDLANSGFKVYLVERDTAIGGRMAQLDKTFPTNDCSMCIISPKLIEVGRHPNIEVLTGTELLELGGEAGHFQAKLKLHPRYVDLEKCTGCGECAKVCPIEVPNEYNMGLNGRRAIRKRYPQAIPGGYAIEKIGTSPCRDACPSHVRVQGYVALAAEGRFDEALKVIRRDLPFPGVCGRVCPHPCEAACNRGQVDEPIAIRQIKRFIADYEITAGKNALPEIAPETGKKIAIVGAGPSGLAAAWFLRLKGHKPVVFEAAPEAGGMLRTGIPSYRLPRDILDAEIRAMQDIGVEIHCNKAVGKDVNVDSLVKDYDALYLSGGAQVGRKLNVPGEDAPGVRSGIAFLREVFLGRPVEIGRKVVVIGGGDVAYDVARTSRRLQAGRGGLKDQDVYLCCLESRAEMLAGEDEILEGEEEGVIRENSVGPVEIQTDASGKVTGVKLRRCTRVFDENKRFSPTFDDSVAKVIPCDTVLVAIGQQADTSFLAGSRLESIVQRGWIKADKLTFATDVPGVFAGGDMQSGPGIAIAAIAHGKEAAVSIDRFLRGEDMKAGREGGEAVIAPLPKKKFVEPGKRPEEAKSDPAARVGSFAEIAQSLTEEEAKAEAKRCLACGICSECGLCVEACQAKAIDHEMRERERTVDVGSVILAPGFEQFEAENTGEFGYGRWANVVTSLEFERMLSATGPTAGHLARPSDHKSPKRVAWIQCVASRDKRKERGFCSSVCCMFATKEAVIATEHAGGDLSATIFMMDLRAMGKGFDEYANRAENRYKVRYVRSMVSRVDEMPESKDLEVAYIGEDGKPLKETFDLLVLSTGLKPTSSVHELARRVGVDVDDYGFAKTDPFAPLATSRPGVFVCGVFQGPKDIPETVAQASGAATYAARGLTAARGTEVHQPELPPEVNVENADQRIGVWVCNCGINIGSVVDVPGVADHASRLPGVVHSEGVLFACSQDNQEHMKKVIHEKGLNRLVVASCTPRTHEPLFQATLRDCGINNYLFSMANIREHCSWVHAKEPEKATQKAKGLVDMAVANARNLKPLHKHDQSLVHDALVVGGGLAGMTAALELADQGFSVTLVEKSDKLGGNLLKVRKTHDGRDVAAYRDALIRRVSGHGKIATLLNSELVVTNGFLGNFESEIFCHGENGASKRVAVKHGATIVATGGHETQPTEYGYGQSSRIITQLGLEELLASKRADLASYKNIVMIQCVGSRNDERPYCSKLCCTQALKNALAIKQIAPDAKVTVLFREMRSYGLKEDMYAAARKAGVLFLRYTLENQPKVVPAANGAKVSLSVARMGQVEIDADLVVLAAAIAPNDNRDISEILKIPRTNEGFFLEVHQKLGPVDFATDGVFMAGLAHGPKPIEETISQAAAAASRAATILSKDHLSVGGVISVVDPEKCAVCLCCVRACPYGVPRITDQGAAYIEPAECRGCGVCASECPGKAIQLQHFTNDQVSAMLTSMQEGRATDG